jgi:hypothetical protein
MTKHNMLEKKQEHENRGRRQKPNHFASSISSLQHLSDSEKTNNGQRGHVNVEDTSSILLILAIRAGAGLGVALATFAALVSLGVVPGAVLLALDLAVILEILEELAELLDIGGGGDNNSAADGIKLGELDPKDFMSANTKLASLEHNLTSQSYHGG